MGRAVNPELSVDVLVLVVVICVVMAAVGARFRGADGWRGSLVALAFIGATIAVRGYVATWVVSLLAGAVAAGLMGGALKMTSSQIANSVLGIAVGLLLAGVLGLLTLSGTTIAGR